MTDTTGQEETAEQETSDTTDTAEQEATSSETPTETLELPGPEPLTESPPDDGKRGTTVYLLKKMFMFVFHVPLVLFSSCHLSSSHHITCPLLIVPLVLFSSYHLSSSHRATCPLLIVPLVLFSSYHLSSIFLHMHRRVLSIRRTSAF